MQEPNVLLVTLIYIVALLDQLFDSIVGAILGGFDYVEVRVVDFWRCGLDDFSLLFAWSFVVMVVMMLLICNEHK